MSHTTRSRVELGNGAEAERVLARLGEDVERDFPEWSPEKPSSCIFAMPNPRAPVVVLSRDPRAGPRVAPVFFIGAVDPEVVDSVMLGLFEGTRRKAMLCHRIARRGRPYLVVPLMYHLVDEESFREALTGHLKGLNDPGVVWLEDRCELVIVHEGWSYEAVRGADGSLEVRGRAPDGEDRKT